jgi:hypothetical protein
VKGKEAGKIKNSPLIEHRHKPVGLLGQARIYGKQRIISFRVI